MNVELDLLEAEDWRLLANLWPLYAHDVSAFNGARPNRHGVISDSDDWSTLEEHAASIRNWWQDRERLKPYLIRVDGKPAGFQLNATHPYLPESIEAEWVIHEFFLLHAFRGQGVGERAVELGLRAQPGTWEVVTDVTNTRAAAFWRRTLMACVGDRCREARVEHAWGPKIAWTFEIEAES